MPFLFVDYDQGAGGEYFCSNISHTDPCVELDWVRYPNTSRTKIYDIFDNEFLTKFPLVELRESTSRILYDIVPTHGNTKLAKEILGDIRSIRVASPTINDPLWEYFKHNQLRKVMLSQLPGPIFTGEIKMLARTTSNPNFLNQVNGKMDSLDIRLLSENVEPTEEIRTATLSEMLNTAYPEPMFDYDLIIPYGDLFFNIDRIKQQLADIFNIKIKQPWLETYRENYEIWLSST